MCGLAQKGKFAKKSSSLYLFFFVLFVFVVWAVVSFPSREIATLALAMTRGGLCAVLALSLMSF